MCFSPEASFFAAGLTASIGLVAMARVRHPRELPLAATPLLFAAQQAIEGFLWLTLPGAPHGAAASGLTLAYLVFALAVWPTFAPLAALTLETDAKRRRLMSFWLAVGLATSAYFLRGLLAHPTVAVIRDDHIVYFGGRLHVTVMSVAYLAAVTAPLLLSSRRTVVAFGAIVLVGCPVAYAFYLEAFQSVWCFFAAAASAVILCHFEWARWRARIVAA